MKTDPVLFCKGLARHARARRCLRRPDSDLIRMVKNDKSVIVHGHTRKLAGRGAQVRLWQQLAALGRSLAEKHRMCSLDHGCGCGG